jgi:SAM-dependent methyltransferase
MQRAAVKSLIRAVVPTSVRHQVRRHLHITLLHLARLYPKLGVKERSELQFWEEWVEHNGREPETEYYRNFMLAMGGLDDPEFFRDKICIDIGCGPKGSLTWLDGIARAAIGVDPLVEKYMRFGIAEHAMLYVASGAESLPFASGYADVVFSMNSLDHVGNVVQCCQEIRRVLKPGGHFIGSLNLDEPPTPTEPWTLTEDFLQHRLFQGWEPEFRRICPRVESNEHFGPYRYMFEPCPIEVSHRIGPRVLWCRYRTALAQDNPASR